MYVSKHNGECRLLVSQELKYLKPTVLVRKVTMHEGICDMIFFDSLIHK